MEHWSGESDLTWFEIDSPKKRVRKMNARHGVRLTVLLGATLATNVAFLIYRIFVTSRSGFDSDAASLMLYAEEVQKAGSIATPDWVFNNGDLWLYNHTLLIVPLLEIFPNSFLVYAISTAIYAVILLCLFGYGLQKIGVQARTTLLSVTILATGISSPFVSELLYDWGGAYGSQFIFTFLIWVLLISVFVNGQSRYSESKIKISGIAVLIFVSSLSNYNRSLIFHFSPLMISLGYILIFKDRVQYIKGSGKDIARTCLVLLSISLAAFIAGAYINRQIIGVSSDAYAPFFYGGETLYEHVVMIFKSYLFLFGFPFDGVGTGGASLSTIPVMSFLGIFHIARIAFVFIISAFFFVYVRDALGALFKNRPYSAILLFPSVSLSIALFVHLTVFRYPLEDDYRSIRYLFVPLLLILTTVAICRRSNCERFLKGPKRTLTVCSLVSLVGFMNHVYPATYSSGAGYESLVDCMRQHDLRYGYSGFWSSNVLTILSDSEIKVRPVEYSHGSIRRFPILNSSSWYKPSVSGEGSFLLFTNKEAARIDLPTWSLLGDPVNQFQCGDYRIFEYDYNLADRIFGNTKAIILSESSPRQIGRVATDSGDIISEVGEAGFLAFGPYQKMEAGDYVAGLSIYSSGSSDAAAGYIDIVANKGAKVLAKTEIVSKREWQEYSIPFVSKVNLTDLEIRIYSNGNSQLTVKNVIEVE